MLTVQTQELIVVMKVYAYMTFQERKKTQCVMDSDGNIIVEGELPCLTGSDPLRNIRPVYYARPTPTPNPTPNPDGGVPPRPQGVR